MLAFVFSGLVVLLDQFFKRWVVRTIDLGTTDELIPGVLGLTHVQNTGAAFSILEGHRWPLAIIAFIACIVIIMVILRYTEGFWGTLGLAAVLGGAVGNLIDRVMYGYVIDMFRTLFVRFAIFNIADIFITLGFITFTVHYISSSIRQAKREREEELAAASVLSGADQGTYIDDNDQAFDEGLNDSYDDDNAQYSEPDPYAQFGLAEDGTVLETPPMDTDPDLSQIASIIDPDYSKGEPIGEVKPLTDFTQPKEPMATVEVSSPNTWHQFYEAKSLNESDTNESDTMDALKALENELGVSDDYDVDALLKEYGFESDKK